MRKLSFCKFLGLGKYRNIKDVVNFGVLFFVLNREKFRKIEKVLAFSGSISYIPQLKIALSHGVALNYWGQQYHGLADSSFRRSQIGPITGWSP